MITQTVFFLSVSVSVWPIIFSLFWSGRVAQLASAQLLLAPKNGSKERCIRASLLGCER